MLSIHVHCAIVCPIGMLHAVLCAMCIPLRIPIGAMIRILFPVVRARRLLQLGQRSSHYEHVPQG
jgi:hypothetical protein